MIFFKQEATMKEWKIYAFLVLFCLFTSSSSHAQSADEVQPSSLKLEQAIPVDPDVTMGKFENGVHYYIKTNKKPEKRATFWLAVNAGSVLENDDQRGLAHFAEHMGFNGTKHFAKQELIDYLESIGMQFGPEVNAYTSFDETVYFLHVPTDSADFVETGFQILEDWAHLITFEDEEIDKERGVIVEEWRLGRGAYMRMLDKQLPILFKDSRYADRLAIGKKEIVESCSYETLKNFYRDWYRPDMMAIVAVGDFDKNWIYNLMEKHFAAIPAVENPRERILYPVPNHDDVLFAIATDPEARYTEIDIYFKSELRTQKTVADYRELLMEQLFNNMLNTRLREIVQKSDPPFVDAFSSKGRFVRTKGVYFLGAIVKENGIERGLDALLTEAIRVRQHGFTPSELERTKAQILRNAEQKYKEADKTESPRIAQNFVYNYLNDEPIPSAKQELALTKQLLSGIQINEVNELVNQWITDNNTVVRLSAPEKEGVKIPSEKELLAVYKAAVIKEIQPYVDAVSDEPLVAIPPKPSELVKEVKHEKLGVTELWLSNGVHVVLKPTDFKNDEILFVAYSHGGNSLVSDKNFISALLAPDIINESGVDRFNSIELQKKLTGKVVNVYPFIDDLSEGFSGRTSPQDIETMFQLIYLYTISPREDKEAYESLISRYKAFLENRSANPEQAFQDTVQVTLAQHHFRARPLSLSLLDELNQAEAFKFYKDRYADASDFNFFFVGNFEIDKIKPLIQSYLGSLPDIGRKESWKNVGISSPKGVIKKEIHKGIEPKSRVQVTFSGPYEGGFENYYRISSLASVLDIKLREILREDLGGTYGVSVYQDVFILDRKEYHFNISFGCSPDRVNEMTSTLFQQIDSIKTFGPKDIYISKVQETQKRAHEVDLKDNNYWLQELRYKHYFGEDWMPILTYPEYVATLSPNLVKAVANKYLDTNNYVQVVLYPEKE
jgi:zinc protease